MFPRKCCICVFWWIPSIPWNGFQSWERASQNQVQLVTREVPRETCAESDAFLLKLKAVAIRAFKNTYSYKCFYTAALSIVFQLCSFRILHNCSIFWAWPILPRIIWFFPMVGFQPIWLKSRLRQGDLCCPPVDVSLASPLRLFSGHHRRCWPHRVGRQGQAGADTNEGWVARLLQLLKETEAYPFLCHCRS